MSPKLFEVTEAGRLIITPEAYMLEETRDILDKYELNAEPYLAYCHLMSAYNSPFRNLPAEEKKEEVIREVYTNIGAFDEEDPLLQKCIDRLTNLYTTSLVRLFNGLESELDNILYYLQTTPITSEDLIQRKGIIADAAKLAASLASVKKSVDEETKANTIGGREVGGIR
jgi:hypothetical protein